MNGLITGTVHDMSRLCTSCLKLDNLKPPCDPAQDNLVRTMDGLPASMQCQVVIGFSGASWHICPRVRLTFWRIQKSKGRNLLCFLDPDGSSLCDITLTDWLSITILCYCAKPVTWSGGTTAVFTVLVAVPVAFVQLPAVRHQQQLL